MSNQEQQYQEALNRVRELRLASIPPVEYFTARFIIDPTSPSGLKWIVGNGKAVKAGDDAGCLVPGGYYKVRTGKKARFPAASIIMYMTTGIWAEDVVDHKDQNPSNNVETNLRLATWSDNAKNCSLSCANTLGFKGIAKYSTLKGEHFRWQASKDYERYTGSGFTTPLNAAVGFDLASVILFPHLGKHCGLNFPDMYDHYLTQIAEGNVHKTIARLLETQ